MEKIEEWDALVLPNAFPPGGTLNTWIKAILKRPFSEAELLRTADGMLRNPPIDPQLRDTMAGLTSKDGRTSLVDFWRQHFREVLSKVAGEPTWPLQRRALLTFVLDQSGWRASYAAANDARHVQSWAHYVEGNQLFDGRPKEQLLPLLTQRWLVAILTEGCLMSLGRKLYAIDTTKKLEIDLHQEYDREIRKMDVEFMDMMLDMVDRYEDEDALRLADFKDEFINPFVKDQFLLLNRIRDGAIMDTLDINAIRQRLTELDAAKREIAKKIDDHFSAEPTAPGVSD